jgi:hypothetical protein
LPQEEKRLDEQFRAGLNAANSQQLRIHFWGSCTRCVFAGLH